MKQNLSMGLRIHIFLSICAYSLLMIGTLQALLLSLQERLIKTKLEKYKMNDKFKEKECSICLDSYMEDDIIIYLECGHYYHNECSKQWFKEGKACPLCRASFS